MPRTISLLFGLLAICLTAVASAADIPVPAPISLKPDVKSPASMATATDGRVYVSDLGETGKDGDGKIFVIVSGKPAVSEGLDDPRGMAGFRTGFCKTNAVAASIAKARPTVLAAATAFDRPRPA